MSGAHNPNDSIHSRILVGDNCKKLWLNQNRKMTTATNAVTFIIVCLFLMQEHPRSTQVFKEAFHYYKRCQQIIM